MREGSEKTRLMRYYRARYERFKILLKWREFIPALKEAVSEVIPDAQIYVFGSALKNELTANSDIDILVVSSRAGVGRHKYAARIEEKLEDRIPSQIFEIHLVTPQQAEWYKKHAKELTPLTSVKKSQKLPA